jgi:hypothetical protein
MKTGLLASAQDLGIRRKQTTFGSSCVNLPATNVRAPASRPATQFSFAGHPLANVERTAKPSQEGHIP